MTNSTKSLPILDPASYLVADTHSLPAISERAIVH